MPVRACFSNSAGAQATVPRSVRRCSGTFNRRACKRLVLFRVSLTSVLRIFCFFRAALTCMLVVVKHAWEALTKPLQFWYSVYREARQEQSVFSFLFLLREETCKILIRKKRLSAFFDCVSALKLRNHLHQFRRSGWGCPEAPYNALRDIWARTNHV